MKERVLKYYRYLIDREDFGDGLGNTWLLLKPIDEERGLFLRKIEHLDKNKWAWAKYPTILYWYKMIEKGE
jgi:hypothetical protein